MATVDQLGSTWEEATSLSTWVDLIRHRFTALSIAPHDPAEVAGTVGSHQVGPLQASSVCSAPQKFVRTASSAASDDHCLLAVGLVDQGTGYLEQDGRSCEITAGQFALYDTSRPFTWAFSDPQWRLRVYTWPHSALPYSDTDTERLTARAVGSDSGVGALLSPMLLRLADDGAPSLAPSSALRLASEVAEMAMIAASDVDSSEALRRPEQDLLLQAQQYIEEHLDDPELSPDGIAQHLFVSVRTLHRLFARQDLTVRAWIKRRRLEACRRALCAPRASEVPIRDIALRYGFTGAPLFSREFTRQYGETPREWRRRHQ